MPPELDPLFAAFQEALAGRYSLERELGRGGMCVFYLAHEVRRERPVAIKLVPPDVAAHAALRERLLGEARTAARRSHPSTVPIHAVEDAGAFVYFAMAYVPGETLARRVELRGPLPAAYAAQVMREVAWALACAHAQGVVHCDIKPENVLLERDTGQAMVADFGIAAVDDATRDTAPGQTLGTPEFMSPEQASGEPVDGRSDLYALGALGFYLLSCRPSFQGPGTARLLAQHLTAPVPSLAAIVPDLPHALARVIERCLAKEPDERPRSGEQLAEALGVVIQGEPEIPAVLRAYLRRVTLSLSAVAISAVGVGLLPYFGPGIPTHVRVVESALIGLAIGAAGSLYVIPLLFRQLHQAGFSPEDVAGAADAMARRRRDEKGVLARWDPSRSPKGARQLLWAFFVVFLLDGAATLMSPSSGWRSLASVAVLAGITLLHLVAIRVSHGSSPVSSLKSWLWRSRLVAWWWKWVTGVAPKSSLAPSRRPTEFRLGLWVDDLFAAMPLASRRELKGVLPLVRRLEARSQAIRAHLDGPDGAVAAARLEQLVAALETVRLDLLRLRTGAASVGRITADLAAATEIEAQIEPLMEERAEVQRLLKGPSED